MDSYRFLLVYKNYFFCEFDSDRLPVSIDIDRRLISIDIECID